jgi:hypothetical protein
MGVYRINQQLWQIQSYFAKDQFQEIKQLYRKSRMPFSMQYDDRLLTPWSDSPELQDIVQQEQERISSIIGQRISPQVAYVSIDLPGSSIMMHRLHPDIYVQVQIVMAEEPDSRMSFAFCHDRDVNDTSEIDYQPNRKLTRHDVDIVHYEPNTASIYVNDPRGFNGMIDRVPNNSIREVLVLSYTREY